MALTPEQVIELKKQLLEQIKHLPSGQREQAQEQIDNMSEAALESMLKQQTRKDLQTQKGIFRMLVDGEIPSKKIEENKEVIAVVSKRAISKGHVLIIPKKVIGDAKLLPSAAFALAKKIAKKLSSKFNAKTSEIQTERAFGEVVVNVIPVYDSEVNINSPRYEATEEEMEEVYKKLRVIEKPKKEKIKIKKKETEVLQLRRRVP